MAQEISPGIWLERDQTSDRQVLRVTNTTNDTLQITLDITGSTGCRIIEAQDGLVNTVTIFPDNSSQLAEIILDTSWSLKMGFRMALMPPNEADGKMMIQDEINELQQIMEDTNIYYRSDVNYFTLNHDQMHPTYGHFIDPYFPPDDSSIYNGSGDFRIGSAIHWRRPKDFFEGNFELFQKIEPDDIQQGSLGDCWFMCALASLTERPELVSELFITNQKNEQGLYRVKFCKGGEWQIVTVDDYFPCQPKKGPIFSRANGNELWVLLLEKAYAKIHGSYMLLRGGFASEGMMDLTGCPTQSFVFENADIQNQIQSGELWDRVKRYDGEGALISASTPGEDRWTEVGGPDQSGGLVPGHAYTVIKLCEAEGNRLLNLRNPWGAFEWDGAWSDTSPLWTPSMKSALNPVLDENDGTFWMSFEDFVNNFTAFNVCRVKDWKVSRLKGLFERFDVNGQFAVLSKYYYKISSQVKSRVFLGIHQDDLRLAGVESTRPYLDIGIIVCSEVNGKLKLEDYTKFVQDRQNELELVTEPGKEYLIIPCTTGCALQRPPNINQVHPLVEDGFLSPIFYSVVQDIFRKANQQIGVDLSYEEFSILLAQAKVQIPQQSYEQFMVEYSSTENGLTLEGFLEFMYQMILQQGEQKIQNWLRLWGYDEYLFSHKSRVLILTTHSDDEINIEQIPRNNFLQYSDEVLALILKEVGQVAAEKQGLQLLRIQQEQANIFLFGAHNTSNNKLKVVLDLSKSKGVLFSSGQGKNTVEVNPGEYKFIVSVQMMTNVTTCSISTAFGVGAAY